MKKTLGEIMSKYSDELISKINSKIEIKIQEKIGRLGFKTVEELKEKGFRIEVERKNFQVSSTNDVLRPDKFILKASEEIEVKVYKEIFVKDDSLLVSSELSFKV